MCLFKELFLDKFKAEIFPIPEKGKCKFVLM